MEYLQYDALTGAVRASNSVRVPDGLLPDGVAQLEVPDGTDPARWSVLSGELSPLPE